MLSQYASVPGSDRFICEQIKKFFFDMDFQIAIWVQFVDRSIVYMYNSEKQTPQWYISLWLYTYTELCVTLFEFVIVKSIYI